MSQPCPFCSITNALVEILEVEIDRSGSPTSKRQIICECGARGPEATSSDDAAWKMWDQRHISQAVGKLLGVMQPREVTSTDRVDVLTILFAGCDADRTWSIVSDFLAKMDESKEVRLSDLKNRLDAVKSAALPGESTA